MSSINDGVRQPRVQKLTSLLTPDEYARVAPKAARTVQQLAQGPEDTAFLLEVLGLEGAAA